MKATIDRVEGTMAVLITTGDQPVVFNLPTSFLGEAREGDIFEITVAKDAESTAAAKVRISSLIEKLRQKSNKE
jgi:hypothetical protein